MDYVAMDIKNSPESYNEACGADVDIEKIRKSVEYLKASGIAHEFRTTVVKGIHTAEKIAECAKWLGANERYYLQSYKVSDDIIAPNGLSAFSEDELKSILTAAKHFDPQTELRGV